MKQILTARDCARLNARMNYGAERSNYYYSVHQGKVDPHHAGKTGLHAVQIIWTDSEGDGEMVELLARSQHAAKTIRKYLFETLPSWPDVDTAPSFDGYFIEDGRWGTTYSMALSSVVLSP